MLTKLQFREQVVVELSLSNAARKQTKEKSATLEKLTASLSLGLVILSQSVQMIRNTCFQFGALGGQQPALNNKTSEN
jgi:hypothetical protein